MDSCSSHPQSTHPAVLALWLTTAALALAACAETTSPIRHEFPPPSFENAIVSASGNVLGAIVSVRVRNADSAIVRYYRVDSMDTVAATPKVRVAADSAILPVLGLYANERYTMTPVAFGPGGTTVGHSLAFTTDTLPADLPHYRASGWSPSPGFVVFAASPYGIVIDNTGRVVWYHRFPGGIGLSFMAQPNGRYTARPPTPTAGDIEPWVEIDALGHTTRALSCGLDLQPRLHDLIALADGSYWILCEETRALDLTRYGVRDARVTGTAVQHVSAVGDLLFHWSPFDHFAIGPDDLSDRTGSNINWTHGNAIDLDYDGNLLVSFRNLSEITKLNSSTGAVIWRLGGRHNQFTFVSAQMPPFARQHGVRVYAAGVLGLLDNVGNPAESRAETYLIEPVSMTARLTSSHAAAPAVVTQIGGSVQNVASGRVLVSFGTAGRVEEYDRDNGVVWQIEGNAGYVFRAQRISSLYTPGVGGTR